MICPYCKRYVTIGETNRDHMLPLRRIRKMRYGLKKKYWPEFPFNTIRCCKSCNTRKGVLTPLEFFMGCKVKHSRSGKIAGILPAEFIRV